MVTLFLDTSYKQLAVGLANENGVFANKHYECWQRQSEYLIPEIDSLLKDNNIQKEDLGDIAVTIGPGSYTGIRIALTVAKIISLALNIKVFPLSSLEVLKTNNKKAICVIDARSGRSYVSMFDKNKRIMNDQILSNNDVISLIKNNPDYTVFGETSYLGIEGVSGDIISNMYFVKQYSQAAIDSAAIKPVYLKDNY